MQHPAPRQPLALWQQLALRGPWALKRHQAAAGFVLPVAMGAAVLLLLSSLSLQTLALQHRSQLLLSERLRRAEDGLSSAAHDLVGTLNDDHGCLLPLPLGAWSGADPACTAPADLLADRRLDEPPLTYRLVGWQPSADGASAELVLELPAAGREPRRQAAFELQLVPDGAMPSWQAVGLRSLGLRGVAA